MTRTRSHKTDKRQTIAQLSEISNPIPIKSISGSQMDSKCFKIIILKLVLYQISIPWTNNNNWHQPYQLEVWQMMQIKQSKSVLKNHTYLPIFCAEDVTKGPPPPIRLLINPLHSIEVYSAGTILMWKLPSKLEIVSTGFFLSTVWGQTL